MSSGKGYEAHRGLSLMALAGAAVSVAAQAALASPTPIPTDTVIGDAILRAAILLTRRATGKRRTSRFWICCTAAISHRWGWTLPTAATTSSAFLMHWLQVPVLLLPELAKRRSPQPRRSMTMPTRNGMAISPT